MRTLLILAALIFHPAAAGADSSFMARHTQTVFGLDSPIPVVQANAVLQTRDGYIWVGSYDGLYRYDGKIAKAYNPVDDGFPSASVTALYEDSAGRLWIGSNNAGLILYDQSHFTVFGLKEGLPSSSVRSITEDGAGNIYAATALGLVAVSPGLQISRVGPGQREIQALSLMVSERGPYGAS